MFAENGYLGYDPPPFPLCWSVDIYIQSEWLFYLTNDKEEINCILYTVKHSSSYFSALYGCLLRAPLPENYFMEEHFWWIFRWLKVYRLCAIMHRSVLAVVTKNNLFSCFSLFLFRVSMQAVRASFLSPRMWQWWRGAQPTWPAVWITTITPPSSGQTLHSKPFSLGTRKVSVTGSVYKPLLWRPWGKCAIWGEPSHVEHYVDQTYSNFPFIQTFYFALC